ncbi:putative xyloglucan endotransglucosylase/hydrolase protein 30 [Curcuma longa]|uniref:putative xyloglucan endotransglucosylase/hydrolase protein 30 n=1 Tax=Curcuma longa TaxID=136217 RepID=UPI003D9ECC76
MAADRVTTTLLLFSLLAASTAALNVTTLSFDDGFSHLFGNDNLVRSGDGRGARLTLNRYSGSGFISQNLYHHGFFSASIRLPADYTAGVVVAFYKPSERKNLDRDKIEWIS